MYWDIKKDTEGGFDFSNYERNKSLNTDLKHKYKKTGTTIVGTIFKDGVVLGSDTRATEGPIVADLDCVKVHYLAPNMYCCGAGTAADLKMVTQMMASELELQRLYTGRQSRIIHAETRLTNYLFRYQGYIGAALIIGGIDVNGPQIVNISPYGNSMRVPFTTMGSGSLAATSILETGYKDNMTQEEAVELVKNAIEAGIFNDLGSGSNVDIFIITKKGCEKKESYRVYNKKKYNQSQNMFSLKVLLELLKKQKNCGKILKLRMNLNLWI